MLYAVKLTLPPTEWEQAVLESREELAPYRDAVDSLPAAKLADLLRITMKRGLAQHHRWLSEHQISAVISPDEGGERTFVFYFDNRKDALAFKQAFVETEGPTRPFRKGDKP
jgi:hypothetical protein